jgi:hypothetical protein
LSRRYDKLKLIGYRIAALAARFTKKLSGQLMVGIFLRLNISEKVWFVATHDKLKLIGHGLPPR